MDVKSVGIVGLGVVGNAIASTILSLPEFELYQYDKYVHGYRDEIYKKPMLKCDVIFICVPTPTNDGIQDLSELNEVMAWLHPLQNANQVICIKSTVLPGTTDKYRQQYGNHICHMPEFLDESTAIADIIKPRRPPIIGDVFDGWQVNSNPVEDVFRKIWKEMDVPKVYHTTNLIAELLKYMSNVFFAMKCLFAHQCQEIMESLSIYESQWQGVLDCFADYSRVGKDHWKVMPKEQFCLGGKCLPKDLEVFAEFSTGKATSIEDESFDNENMFHMFMWLHEAYKRKCKK